MNKVTVSPRSYTYFVDGVEVKPQTIKAVQIGDNRFDVHIQEDDDGGSGIMGEYKYYILYINVPTCIGILRCDLTDIPGKQEITKIEP